MRSEPYVRSTTIDLCAEPINGLTALLKSKRGGPRRACKIAINITRYDDIIIHFLYQAFTRYGYDARLQLAMMHGFNNHYNNCFTTYWWCETTDGDWSFFLG